MTAFKENQIKELRQDYDAIMESLAVATVTFDTALETFQQSKETLEYALSEAANIKNALSAALLRTATTVNDDMAGAVDSAKDSLNRGDAIT